MTVKWKLQARNEMARARKALRAAEALLGMDLLEDAVSRAYYAVLHAARAALATDEKAPKTHSGVLAMLGERLVKTGMIEVEYSRIFSVEQDDREFCDYVSSFRMGRDKAELRIREAGKFVDRIERYLKEQKNGKGSGRVGKI